MKIIPSILLTTLLLFLNAAELLGSSFVGDQITINGESWEIMGNILSTDQRFHEFEKYAQQAYYDEPDSIKEVQIGYDTRAYWVIEDGKLCLEKIDLYFISDSNKCYELTKNFYPEYVHNGKIVVDWDMDRTFRLLSGNYLRIAMSGFERGSSRQMFLSIKNGKVLLSRQFGENPYENDKTIFELLNEYISLYYCQYCSHWPLKGNEQDITLTCPRNGGESIFPIILSTPEINPYIIITGLFCSPWDFCLVSKEGKKYVFESGIGRRMFTQSGIDELNKFYASKDRPKRDFDNLPALYEGDTLTLYIPDFMCP